MHRENLERFLGAVRKHVSLGEEIAHHAHLATRPAEHAEPEWPGLASVRSVLEARGIERLYSHQARALDQVAAGRHTVLSTATASGKTLVYSLPALARALERPGARALYLFPLRALEQDQAKRLEADLACLDTPTPPRVAIYDGDTSASARKKIREHPPNVLITTPDMLHAGILPHHETWRAFFEGLEIVVVDELHTYRGIFGSHVAQVLRRLRRVARHHGATPQYVAASATVANPGELASGLTGEPFEVVSRDGAPQPPRHVLLMNPQGSAYTTAARLFRLAVQSGLRTIAFTKARTITELMYTWIVEADPELRSRISSYRAGFLPEERRDIERRLFSGDLAGVISTSALEMGIDVGGLDVCLLVGYPGSQIASWQRGGRVGRTREAVIAMIAGPDALDQYLVHHPDRFLEGRFEHAVLDPANPDVAAAHLPCAAAELPLRAGEPWLAEAGTAEAVRGLEETGSLLQSESGREWFAARRRPHREVNLRAAGSSYSIVLDTEPEPGTSKDRVIGSVGSGRVFAECHEGAIYLHRGRAFLVRELDWEERKVRVRAVDAPYYTRAVSEKDTEILERVRARPAGNFRLVQGRVKVTTHITGFERRRVHGQDLLGTEPLDLPPTSFETTSVWLEMPEALRHAVEEEEGHFMGGIHAVEHAALALFPLFALCDRHDVAGISFKLHPELGIPAIFLYDGVPGGVGLAPSVFDRIEGLLEATLEMVRGCDCENGCPACVHSPKCGSGNRPIDKRASVLVLEWLLGARDLPVLEPRAAAPAPRAAPVEAQPESEPEAADIVFFDLETQRSAQEVGGWQNAHLMRVALAVLYETRSGEFRTYREGDVEPLIARLARADLVVGFNVNRFDYRVLRGYSDQDFSTLATWDMLDAIHQRLGYRLALGHLGEETLGTPKSADGLQSLRWWKEGRIEEIESYCRDDVALLRDLFEHARSHGHLLFRTKQGERVRLPLHVRVPELIEGIRKREPRQGTAPGARPRRASVDDRVAAKPPVQ